MITKFINTKSGTTSNTGEPLRFAHPFITTVPINKRANIPGIGNRMTDHIKTKLEQIPKQKREPTMALDEIIGKAGVTEIVKAKSISFPFNN